ncbi:DUF1919 domain-containing protein [Clostridium perfringens]|uniref:DUF1919 domain-containing protein n=1 Tax=Clostridium perfringens TaxID=1502 RepID=UPI0022E11AA3|nr:DUF1919 domain-containing protein [Clostridium perfringens]MDM0632410.1 DUF1919 domain-containing protein [Clostridium perfringens]
MLDDLSIVRTKQSITEILRQKFFLKISVSNRKKINKYMNEQIEKKDFTIISSFCGGGTLYHDIGMKFLSPTINLAFDGEDFCSFCENLEYNLSQQIREYKTDKVSYPVGKIGDNIEIRFVHYKTFEEAVTKWNERVKRINFEKIFIMATDRDGMNSKKCLSRFDRLPYKKVMFTAQKYDYDWAVYCPCFKGKSNVGIMTGISGISGKRFYEKYFDILKILNSL